MRIYSSYDDEPEELYLPLPADLYREYYDLEMTGYSQDFPFYEAALKPFSDILELGCGSGRLTRFLSASGHRPLGIDLSLPMLRAATSRPGNNDTYVCMDMCRLGLRKRFDAIIIAYNTLNLLTDNSLVQTCLNGCRDHLQPDGRLLLQLYIPCEQTQSNPENTTFHFQMFDRPQGGKIIKEILRRPLAGTGLIEMTERYKIRPMQPGVANTNYAHTMLINANSRAAWHKLLHTCGFAIDSLSQPSTSTLFATAKQQR